MTIQPAVKGQLNSWIIFEPSDGQGNGRHIVLVSGRLILPQISRMARIIYSRLLKNNWI
jgi:hypothetical protein